VVTETAAAETPATPPTYCGRMRTARPGLGDARESARSEAAAR
jgi:hypothetical protein